MDKIKYPGCGTYRGCASMKIVAGAILFFLTWFLEPTAVKTLWMVLTAALTIFGIAMLLKAKTAVRK